MYSSCSSSSTSQPDEICMVCCDIASGYHYGVPSCNGCKTFFRRTIVHNSEYVCQNDGKCPIDKNARCTCRYCRFEKCLKVGMSKEAIQQNREPIGYTKRNRKSSLAKQNSCDSGCSTSKMLDENAPLGEELLQSFITTETRCMRLRAGTYQPYTDLTSSLNGSSRIFDEQFVLEHSRDVEPARGRKCKFGDLAHWYHIDFSLYVDWAKTSRIFCELSIPDKLALLRQYVIQWLIHQWSYYSLDSLDELDGNKTIRIVFPNGVFFDDQPSQCETIRQTSFLEERQNWVSSYLPRLKSLNMDHTEFAACKAMVFLSPDAEGLSSEGSATILNLRASLAQSFHRYLEHKCASSQEAGDRFGEILVLNTHSANLALDFRNVATTLRFFELTEFSDFERALLFDNEHTMPDRQTQIDIKQEC